MINRRMRMVATYLFFVVVSLNKLSYSDGPISQAHYPAFSWDTVPVAFHFGKGEALMTEEEARFVAEHSSLICLEKGHAAGQYKYSEDGIENEALRLKKINPEMKVIFYWNTFLDYPMFRAHEEYQKHPEWWLRNADGDLDKKLDRIKRYDLSNAAVRSWWTSVAQKAVVQGSCDGIFMDAFPQIVAESNRRMWGTEKYEAIQRGLDDLVNETRVAIGNDKLIFFNGIRSTPSKRFGNEFVEKTDAVMVEHFGHFNSDTKECMLSDILEMSKAAKLGKIVVFKGWPGFSWLDRKTMQQPLDVKRNIAAEKITFPLAAFLVGAERNCYFVYNWGYRMEMGCLEWYPEFDMPLGKPLGEMVRKGWTLSRKFQFADVTLNLETRDSKIRWKETSQAVSPATAERTNKRVTNASGRQQYLETGGERKLEVVYKTVGAKELRMDLYYPTNKTAANCPTIVFTHGGGWAAGNRYKVATGSFGEVFRRLVKKGFAVATVSYRLAKKQSNVAIRDCLIDCKDAVRYLAKHSDQLGIDPTRFFVMGDSAGGHLAQMLLLSSDESFAGEASLADASYEMIAGVSWYGPCDFENMDLFNHDDRPGFRDRFAERIMGSDSGSTDKLLRYREVSPINYLARNSPSLLMIQGNRDTTIPVKHAYYMQEKAAALGAPVQVEIVKNAGHNWRRVDADISPTRDEIVDRTVKFFEDHLQMSIHGGED